MALKAADLNFSSCRHVLKMVVPIVLFNLYFLHMYSGHANYFLYPSTVAIQSYHLVASIY